jgi:hypothetical protein
MTPRHAIPSNTHNYPIFPKLSPTASPELPLKLRTTHTTAPTQSTTTLPTTLTPRSAIPSNTHKLGQTIPSSVGKLWKSLLPDQPQPSSDTLNPSKSPASTPPVIQSAYTRELPYRPKPVPTTPMQPSESQTTPSSSTASSLEATVTHPNTTMSPFTIIPKVGPIKLFFDRSIKSVFHRSIRSIKNVIGRKFRSIDQVAGQ